MYKKYDHRLVTSYRSYKVRDICRLFRAKKLHEQTIRAWVNEGKLKAIWHGKTIYIYGAALKQSLIDKNNHHKRTLEFCQFRCGKCKNIAPPLNYVITKLTTGRGGCISAFGICTHCTHRMNRLYKVDKRQQILESFTIEHNELVQLSDSVCSASNTHIKPQLEIALSESLKNRPPDKTTASINRTNMESKIINDTASNAHINQQLNLFQ